MSFALPLPARQFLAAAPDTLLYRELDGLTLAFHRPSGQTHILAPPAPQILAALQLGPADSGEIVARLNAWHDIEGEEAWQAIEARLHELECAGLVSRA